jgi:hypothetical protein
MARVFAIQVRIILSITRVAVQIWSEPVNYHGTGFLLGALAPLKRGYKLSRSQKSVTVHDFNWGAGARVRVHIPLKSCLGSRSKSKNRDKQLNHIVRVSFSSLFNDLAVRVLSAVPDSVDNDLILSNLIVDYVIFNY